MASPPITLLDHYVPVVPLPMHKQQQEARDGKKDAVHDAERKTRFQHGAMLIRVQMKRRTPTDSIIVNGDGEVGVGGEICAVCIGDVAELVDAGDEGADEAEVDERYKDGGVTGGFTAEDSGDGPGGGQDGNDEEDEDGVGGEEVL